MRMLPPNLLVHRVGAYTLILSAQKKKSLSWAAPGPRGGCTVVELGKETPGFHTDMQVSCGLGCTIPPQEYTVEGRGEN